MREEHKSIYKHLGINIAYYRKMRGLTQERLAEKVNISRNHMSRIETGDCPASLEVLFDLADALETDVEKFFRKND